VMKRWIVGCAEGTLDPDIGRPFTGHRPFVNRSSPYCGTSISHGQVLVLAAEAGRGRVILGTPKSHQSRTVPLPPGSSLPRSWRPSPENCRPAPVHHARR
jgi:hypothetical protein